MDHRLLGRHLECSSHGNGAGFTGPIFLPRAGWKELLLLAFGRRKRYKVENESMLPLLSPGAEVLTSNLIGFPKEGEIWVLRHPTKPRLKIIKMVTEVSTHGIVVLGLNSEKSEDSRSFGAVAPSLFLGKVESRFL